MPSRRDQIQSYQFAVQRTVSAMVAGEADPAETPLRRLVGAGFGSIMVGVLALAAVGIFGLVTGRSSAGWREGNAVILERETGAAFVIRDGTLIPAVNFTSALLMQQAPDTVTVSRKDLASMPRGGMAGIPNAPDAIPSASGLLSAGWTICTAAKPTSSGDVGTSTALYVGSAQAGGRGLGDDAVLVKLTTGEGPYLIWHGYRYRINNAALVLEALAMRQEPQTVVGGPWLTALPEGGPIGPLALDGWGNQVTYIAGLPDTRVGQVLVVASAADNKQHYLVEGARLRPLTELEASLALGDPNARKAYPNVALEARQVSASVANSTPRAPAPTMSAERPPERLPRMVRLARSDASICGTFEPGPPCRPSTSTRRRLSGRACPRRWPPSTGVPCGFGHHRAGPGHDRTGRCRHRRRTRAHCSW